MEFRENLNGGVFTESTSDGTSQNTRTSSGGDRNEVVGLKFDLSGYTLADLTNVTLNLYAYRLDNSTRQVSVYGVHQGTVSGTGTYTTETWNESATHFGDLPGLQASDGDCSTQSLNQGALTPLGNYTIGSGQPEGTLHTFNDPSITAFVQSYSGSSFLTFVLAANSTSTGQFRTTTRETTATETSVLTGNAGDFAPYLKFDIIGTSPTSGLVITNTMLSGDTVVLSGTGGSNSTPFVVLGSSDISLPVTNWPPVSTNNFDSAGNFNVTNPWLAGLSQQYFRLLTLVPPPDPFGPIGFATVNGGITGGAGGTTQTVSTVPEFIGAVTAGDPRIVLVSGALDLNGSGTGSVSINSDKTIIGLSTNAVIGGQLQISGENNVIIRNLTVTNNGAPSVLDGVRIVNGSHHIWVDHCTFVDCSDGELDITVGSDYVTVSWCKFNYTRDNGHNFVNLIAAADDDAGNYRITFHHNWWSTLCKQRMPMSRYGTVHLFNNYYFAPGNQYCSNARTNAQFLSENNYYRQVDDPIYKESNGRIKTSGNMYVSCTGAVDPGTSTLDAVLNPPPYPYTLDATVDVPNLITNGAGVGKGPFVP